LFPEAASAALRKYCNYQWSDETSDPTTADINALPAKRSANCTYVTPQQAAPDGFTLWARDELLPPASERLPASGAPASVDIKVRVVVLDTAPLEASTSLPSRHGRTLAQMIRESACQNASINPADCAVEVRSALALPFVMAPGTTVPQWERTGGYFGLLSHVTSAIWFETNNYRSELERQSPESRRTTPTRVIFNESFGFGNTDAFPNRCGDTPPANDVTTAALFDALMTASCLGILHVAAAGNHTGGTSHLDGMLCPARWDHAIVPTDDICQKLWGEDAWKGTDKDKGGLQARFKELSIAKTREQREFSLFSPASSAATGVGAPGGADSLLSVGGVDYHGLPIVLTRPKACPEAVAIGIGGNGLVGSADVLPFLFGTSVSAAVASARIAVQWARNPFPTATQIHVSNGSTPTPFQRETGICGGSPIACTSDIPWIGRPAAQIVGQNRAWPDTPVNTLWQPLAPRTEVAMDSIVCLDKLPHCRRPSRAITADVWPQPVDPVCIKCGIYLSPDTASYPELWIEPNPAFHAGPTDALLIVEDQRGVVVLTRTVSQTSIITSSRTALRGVDRRIFKDARVWLSGYDSERTSYAQQIFVDQ